MYLKELQEYPDLGLVPVAHLGLKVKQLPLPRPEQEQDLEIL